MVASATTNNVSNQLALQRYLQKQFVHGHLARRSRRWVTYQASILYNTNTIYIAAYTAVWSVHLPYHAITHTCISCLPPPQQSSNTLSLPGSPTPPAPLATLILTASAFRRHSAENRKPEASTFSNFLYSSLTCVIVILMRSDRIRSYPRCACLANLSLTTNFKTIYIFTAHTPSHIFTLISTHRSVALLILEQHLLQIWRSVFYHPSSEA